MGKSNRSLSIREGGGRFYLLLLCLSSALLACTDPNVIRLRGSFENLRQTDLYIYSPDGGMDHVDTIRIIDGQFNWQTTLTEEATFYLVFPNMSEQVILAAPGDRLRLKGDGGQLRALTIKGSDDNEELTRFRLAHLADKNDSLATAIREYIREHQGSRVSIVLQRQLTRLQGNSSRLRVNATLPTIILPPDSVVTTVFTEMNIDLKTGKMVRGKSSDRNTEDTLFIRPKQKEARPVLLIFWATWKRSTLDDFTSIRKVLREHKNLQPVSISLDHQRNSYLYAVKADSIDFDRRCYLRVWDTPVVQQLAISEIPYYILTDSAHTVLALGTNWKKDIAPAIEKLGKVGSIN